VNTLERPDVWFVPSEVWEVRGADLTLSPKHAAAAGARHAERGISLRFPRFVAARPDKSPEDASGPAEVLALFDAQARRWGGQGGLGGAQAAGDPARPRGGAGRVRGGTRGGGGGGSEEEDERGRRVTFSDAKTF
jgi:hypothetical protein